MRVMMMVLPLLVTAACSEGGASAGTDQRKVFGVGAFDAVKLAGSDSVVIVRGAPASVVATGPSEILERLDIGVQGTTLVVTRRSAVFAMASKGATITVTMPALRQAELAGSGDINIDLIDGNNFEGIVTGSGDMALPRIAAGDVRLRVTGSGDLRATGTARRVEATLTGSGTLDAEKLVAGEARLSVQGSGDATLGAQGTASINLTGSGDARIVGTDRCKIDKTGAGEAVCER